MLSHCSGAVWAGEEETEGSEYWEGGAFIAFVENCCVGYYVAEGICQGIGGVVVEVVV